MWLAMWLTNLKGHNMNEFDILDIKVNPESLLSNPPENTFVIPTMGKQHGIERCIETIYKYNENFRIILIDQTPDGECFFLQDRVHLYIHSYRNLGFAKAMNIGIKISNTPFVTCCNDDVEFISKRWFNDIKLLFAKNPNILAATPASVKEFTDDRSKDYLPYKEEYTNEDYNYLLEPKEGYNASWVFEGCMTFCTVFMRKSIEMVGLFDEGFFPGGSEDYDWCRRCYAIKYQGTLPHKLVSYMGSFVYHHWSSTVRKTNWDKMGEQLKKYRVWPGFREKWMSSDCEDPDIYAKKGNMDKPTVIMPL